MVVPSLGVELSVSTVLMFVPVQTSVGSVKLAVGVGSTVKVSSTVSLILCRRLRSVVRCGHGSIGGYRKSKGRVLLGRGLSKGT